MDETRALQYPRQAGNEARSPTGDGGTVLAIPHVAGTEFSGAATHRRESCAPDQGREFSAEDFVSEAKFAAAAGVIAEIETAAGTLVAENGDAGLAGELVA